MRRAMAARTRIRFVSQSDCVRRNRIWHLVVASRPKKHAVEPVFSQGHPADANDRTGRWHGFGLGGAAGSPETPGLGHADQRQPDRRPGNSAPTDRRDPHGLRLSLCRGRRRRSFSNTSIVNESESLRWRFRVCGDGFAKPRSGSNQHRAGPNIAGMTASPASGRSVAKLSHDTKPPPQPPSQFVFNLIN